MNYNSNGGDIIKIEVISRIVKSLKNVNCDGIVTKIINFTF